MPIILSYNVIAVKSLNSQWNFRKSFLTVNKYRAESKVLSFEMPSVNRIEGVLKLGCVNFLIELF